MIQGTFDVAIDTPKYHKRGTLALKSEGDELVAELNAGSLEGVIFKGTCSDKQVTFEGSGEYGLLGHVDYQAAGEVWGNSIDIKAETNVGTVTIFGTRLSMSTGGMKSSHEYMMAASRAEFAPDDGTMYSGMFSD